MHNSNKLACARRKHKSAVLTERTIGVDAWPNVSLNQASTKRTLDSVARHTACELIVVKSRCSRRLCSPGDRCCCCYCCCYGTCTQRKFCL